MTSRRLLYVLLFCLATAKAVTSDQSGDHVFSPYKDIGIGLDWNTNIVGSDVTGSHTTVAQAMPEGLSTVTLAFATGECGSETWSTIPGDTLASANVQALVDAGKNYVIATGGAQGAFTCGSTDGFTTFLDRWMSPNFVGVDFDIEVGQSQADVNNLVALVKEAEGTYPDLRFSFTIAAYPKSLSSTGDMVVRSVKAAGLDNSYINLMPFDFGDETCTKNPAGQCDLGQSAIDSANMLNKEYGIPYNQIELTPMIGGTDVVTEVFTLDDAVRVGSFAADKGLGGIHFWSFDRDRDCPPGGAVATCNSYGQAGTLGFTNKFLDHLPGW